LLKRKNNNSLLSNLKTIGIGIDIVEVDRFEKIQYESNKSFYKKIFTDSEIQYCTKFSDPYKHFAVKFALKEAVKKSISKNVKMSDIVTAYKKSKPIVLLKDNKEYRFMVSLSHEKNHAIAIVMSEKLSFR
jgi:holo-[acyl-carrier protein] synthase